MSDFIAVVIFLAVGIGIGILLGRNVFPKK